MKIGLRGFVIEDIEGEPPCARLLGELSNTRLERIAGKPGRTKVARGIDSGGLFFLGFEVDGSNPHAHQISKAVRRTDDQ
jgi:hypothetical protein